MKMSEFVGSRVNIKCKKHGNVTGFVDEVSDERIILNSASSEMFPGTVLEYLSVLASDIIDLDIVQQGEAKEQHSSSQSSTEHLAADTPSTRCAYVCPTTPVRPMRPMRALKGDDLATASSAFDKAHESKTRQPAKQQALLKPQPQLASSQTALKQQASQFPSHQQANGRHAAASPKNGAANVKNVRDRNDPVIGGPQTRRRAFSASYEAPAQFGGLHGVGRGVDCNAGNGNGRRLSRTARETWYDMSVTAMQEEFDFESNLLKFDKSEFYRQVDAENQRQNVSPLTIRSKPGSGDGAQASNFVASISRNGGRGNCAATRKTSRPGKDSCFDMDVSQMDEEFDFEGNLAQFNKSEFYKEVDERRQRHEKDKCSPETVPRRPDVVPEPKYRHDENIIPSHTAPLRQPVSLPSAWQGVDQKRYSCADSVVLPSCPVELRRSLFTAAETLSLSWSLVAELFGRTVAELVVEQVGGRTRLRPGNEHQLPHVAVVAGNHVQGSLGVAVARHLAARRCSVSLVVPQMRIGQMEAPREMSEQVALFESLTRLPVLHDLESCSSKATDFVVSAIESHEESKNELLLFQPWISGVIAFCNANRAPCLVVDPPPVKGFIRPRLMVGLGLPLAIRLTEQSKAAYFLCDVGLTPAVFRRVGISYASPFTFRSILQLSDLDGEEEKTSSR